MSFLPLLGANVSLTFVLSLRWPFAFRVSVRVLCPLALLATLERPLPLTTSVPAAGTATFSVSVRFLTLCERIVSLLGSLRVRRACFG